jgi:hypothetical protein
VSRSPITIAIMLVGIVVAYLGVTAFTGIKHLKQNIGVQVSMSKTKV